MRAKVLETLANSQAIIILQQILTIYQMSLSCKKKLKIRITEAVWEENIFSHRVFI